MRGDLETLFYNMVQWLGLKFPWEENLKDSHSVQQQKENAFKNVEQFLKDWSKKTTIPSPIAHFMKALAIMNETDQPTYYKFIKILDNGLKKVYHVPYGNLEFSINNVHADNEIVEVSDQGNEPKRYKLTNKTKLKLAYIISENCRHEGEVKLRNTGSHSLIQVIYALMGKKSQMWQRRIANAWERNENNLKTITKKLWASKAKKMTKSEAALKENVYQELNQNPSASAQANTCEMSCSITGYRSISESDFSAMSPRGTSPHEDLPSPDLPNTSSLSILRSLLEARSATPFKWDGVQSPLSQPSSRGLCRCHSSQDSRLEILSPFKTSDEVYNQFAYVTQQHQTGNSDEQLTEYREYTSLDDEQWPSMYEWLNAWLEMKELILLAFGSIPSEPMMMISQVNQMRVLLDDFRMQNPRIGQLTNVLANLPPDSADAQKLKRIEQRWREQLDWLEERGQELGCATFTQLREALQEVSSNLDKLSDEIPEEQLLRKVEILAEQLEGQRTPLVSAKTVTKQLCLAFNDPDFSADLRTELQSVNNLYDDLQHGINVKKTEIETSLSDGHQFDYSCQKITVWLAEELDMSEKLIVSD